MSIAARGFFFMFLIGFVVSASINKPRYLYAEELGCGCPTCSCFYPGPGVRNPQSNSHNQNQQNPNQDQNNENQPEPYKQIPQCSDDTNLGPCRIGKDTQPYSANQNRQNP